MRLLAPLLALFLGACATIATLQLDDRFGPADPSRFDRPPASVANGPDYWKDVRPLLDRRCVSCHACYDAPCQLNLTSYAGLTRGANPQAVYSGQRLLATEPTRLGIDAHSSSEWRSKGFFPVLNERQPSPQANREGGVMYRLLAQKQLHPGPTGGQLTDKDIDLDLSREQTCTTAEGFETYINRHPARGMPFALPPLSRTEHDTLSRWLETGAPYRPATPLPAGVTRRIAEWESFLNGDSLKERLMARYIFEHWFIGHIWFPEMPGQYFQLVRSRTPPGQPIDLVATRRPYDDPGVDRPWYRLQRIEATGVAKTHMPLQLDPERMARLRTWFLAPSYPVAKLPGYAPEIAANPFVTFRDLPLVARYRLMLDDAQFTLSGFMKGPVCRGQMALNSINDHFWVFFVAPSDKNAQFMADIIDAASPVMRLPAEQESTAGLLAWREYARLERQYTATRHDVTLRLRQTNTRPTLTDIWDGDASNPNVALTVFRHYDSASVIQGLSGERPQTTFVMGYPVLERMHYLLTAGFDVFGNVGHQLATRLYMDFLRMESELNFLALLPLDKRQDVLNYWYRERSEPHNRYFADAKAYFPQETGIRYRTAKPLDELYDLLQQRTARARNRQFELAASGLPDSDLVQLRQLSAVRGIPASLMPEDSLILHTPDVGKPVVISLVRNSAHLNVAEIFDEADRRRPEEDSLLAMNGIVGAYPNAIFTVNAKNIANFTSAVASLKNPEDVTRLVEQYGIRRTDPRFWPTSDRIHDLWQATRPIEFGILDYSRLENL
jgi:hypothetical protein